MTEDKHLYIFGLFALLGFFAFLAYLIYQSRKQETIVTTEDIERARQIVRGLRVER